MSEEKPVVVITGAASGLGFALAKACIQSDMRVVMADCDIPNLMDRLEWLSLSTQSELMGVVCDVRKREDVNLLARQTIDRFHRVDLLINNAGISGPLAPLWELTNEQIRAVLDTNLSGVLHGVQAFLPFMFKQTHRAHIVNMSSLYGLCSGPSLAPYAMSKHAILALSESLYFDLKYKKKPVDVSVVCPSFVKTALLTNSSPLYPDLAHQIAEELLQEGRSPDEVALEILRQVQQKIFYILPDDEAKLLGRARMDALIAQKTPIQPSMERVLL